MRSFIRRRPKLAALLVVVVALSLAGVAYAVWTITATGPTGNGSIGTLVAPTVTAPAAPTGVDCYPGQTCSIVLSVNNPNTNALKLTGLSSSGSTIHVDKPFGTANSGCPTTNITWAQSLNSLNIAIPTGSTTVTIPGAYTLDPNAPSACQGSVVYNSNLTTYTFSTP